MDKFLLIALRSISAHARGGEIGKISFTAATLIVPPKLASAVGKSDHVG